MCKWGSERKTFVNLEQVLRVREVGKEKKKSLVCQPVWEQGKTEQPSVTSLSMHGMFHQWAQALTKLIPQIITKKRGADE